MILSTVLVGNFLCWFGMLLILLRLQRLQTHSDDFKWWSTHHNCYIKRCRGRFSLSGLCGKSRFCKWLQHYFWTCIPLQEFSTVLYYEVELISPHPGRPFQLPQLSMDGRSDTMWHLRQGHKKWWVSLLPTFGTQLLCFQPAASTNLQVTQRSHSGSRSSGSQLRPCGEYMSSPLTLMQIECFWENK